ncbi:MAG: hypothetical protein LAO08_20255 [Acidobacteriia bacterium]|nr:hypothetical protein [Terriglobia bacterium]
MSIGSFFHKVEQEFVKLFRAAPSYEQKVQSVIAYVGPVVVGIIGMVDPAVAPEANAVMKTVQSDLSTVSALTQAGQVTPGTPAAATVVTSLNAIKMNVGGLLALAEVKNSAKVNEITAAVNMIVGEMDAMLSGAPA